jgi:hypothetical protein
VRDPQRTGLAELLDSLAERAPESLVRSALVMAERSERWEHRSAAESYALCALAIGQRYELGPQELAALRRLAQVSLGLGDAAAASDYAQRAAALALQLGRQEEWAYAMADAADAAALGGGAGGALAVVEEVRARAREWRMPGIAAIARLTSSRHMLADGDPESALNEAWQGLAEAPRAEQRVALLERVLQALSSLGLFDQADHCAALLEARAGGAPQRLTLRARRARLRAEAGDAEGFRSRAAALSERPGALPAAARLELARGGLLTGDHEGARRHASSALQIARNQLQPQTRRDATALLATLDEMSGRVIALPKRPQAPGQPALKIAAAVLSLGETLAPSAL